MTKDKKLQRLQEIGNPMLAMQRMLTEHALASAVDKMEMMRGETPVRGVDYFTEADIAEMLNHLQAFLEPGPKGDKGESIIGPEGPRGLAGYSPNRGIDYWTAKDKKEIIAEVQKTVKDGKDGSTPKMSDIVDAVMGAMAKKPIKYSNLEGAPDPKSVSELIAYLKRGGYRGGGSSTSGPVGSTGSIIAANNSGDNQHYTLNILPTTTAYYAIINNGSYTTDDAVFPFSVSGKNLTFTNALPNDLANTIIKLICV